MKRSRTQSEFGGRSGLVASEADGHERLTSREELWALYATDSTDASSVPERENIGMGIERSDWYTESGSPGTAAL